MILPDKKENTQSGQALIIILLAMTVALTLVLSSVSRSITDVQITDQEEESFRAFSASEAGVEQALLQLTRTGSLPAGGICDDLDGSEYCAVPAFGSAGSHYEHPRDLGPGESVTFWFVGHDNEGKLSCAGGACTRTPVLKFCWGKRSYSQVPDLEVQVYYDETEEAINSDDYSNVKVHTFFESAGICPIDELKDNYAYGANVNVVSAINSYCNPNTSNCLIAAKARPINNYQQELVQIAIGTAGNQRNMPAQGVQINSTGIAGESTRKLNVEYTFSSAPGIFDNTVFSGSELKK